MISLRKMCQLILTISDLYCGIGTISLFLAQKAKKVYGVEIVPAAIEDARRNAELNGITNAEFFVGKAEEVLPEMYAKGEARADVIVVDPPRKGCDAALLETVVKMQPERIVYVSCDSATLARDLKWLCAEGYEMKKVRGVDMFPMTGHVETVCLLSNRKCAGNEPKSELAPDIGECRGTAESVKGFLRKPDTHVDLTLDMEDYYRIKDQEKQSNK